MRRTHDLYFHRGVRFDNNLAPTIFHEERRVLLQRLNWERSPRRPGEACPERSRSGASPKQTFCQLIAIWTEILVVYHKPLMIDGSQSRMTETQKQVREYLAKIGRRGGVASRRELTRAHAKQMVAIREAKRAALKAGKPWPPRDRKLLKLT
jgi:hypothetical protein